MPAINVHDGWLNELLGDAGTRCMHVYRGSGLHLPCGLPAWPGAGEREPRCEFHAGTKPADIRARLVSAVEAACQVFEANLAGLRLEESHPGARPHLPFASEPKPQRLGLRRAKLHGANLAGTHLWNADMTGADLSWANLAGAHLEFADLVDSQLWGADLSCAGLEQVVATGASLREADLSGADLRAACLRNSDLRATRLDSRMVGPTAYGLARPVCADLRGADLRGAYLLGVTLVPGTNLTGAVLGPSADGPGAYIIRDEAEAPGPGEWGDPLPGVDGSSCAASFTVFGECASVYRQLRLSCEHFGDHTRASGFFVREMHCLRRQMGRDGGRRTEHALWWLYEKVAGYGEWPGRVALVMLTFVLLFGLAQGYLGIRESPSQMQITGNTIVIPEAWAMKGIEAPSVEGFWRGMKAMYFSLITFTTTGYGDLQPAPGLGRLLAGMEAALGMTLMSLFLVCIVRKFSR